MTHMGKTPPPKGPGFEPTLRQIPIAAILPVKQLPTTVPKGQKYAQIAASIREAGLIEPLVIARAPGQDGTFILLDGHVRLHVLKEMGEETVTCLVATDDESFTYNKRISRLATIQEHKMILRAIERGVPEARIAAALNVDVALIRRKRTLLNGICPEAAELLKDKHCPVNSFRSLRKMKPLRQIQAAELMIAANNYTVAYSEATRSFHESRSASKLGPAMICKTFKEEISKPKGVLGLRNELSCHGSTEPCNRALAPQACAR